MDHEEEQNIYYVALTRGKQNIYLNDAPCEDNFEVMFSYNTESMGSTNNNYVMLEME